MKTSWRRISSSSSGDVFINTNTFALLIRLQETSSRRLQDVLIKTNIFVLAIRLQDVFKTFSRRLQDSYKNVFKTFCMNVFKTSSRRLANFKTSCKDVFKTFSRRIIRLNILPRSHFWEIYGQCRKFARVIKISQVLTQLHGFSFSLYYIFLCLLTEAFLEPGRTSTREHFLQKYLTPLSCSLFSKKNLHRRCSTGL